MKDLKFKSLKEEREYWDTHSIADIWDSLEQIELKFTKKREAKDSIGSF